MSSCQVIRKIGISKQEMFAVGLFNERAVMVSSVMLFGAKQRWFTVWGY